MRFNSINDRFLFLEKCGYEITKMAEINRIEISLKTDRFGYMVRTDFNDIYRDDFVEQVIIRFNVLLMNEKIEKFMG